MEGFNELPSSKPKNIFTIAFGVIKEPMFLLLVACGSLYLACPRALVIRDGKESRIAGREVATGDIVVLQEGDRVPADAAVFQKPSKN